jgi:hypothetical protein
MTTYRIEESRAEVFRSPHRYVRPSEPGLMATFAGMGLTERWTERTETPFTAASRSHVSVRPKAAG